MKLSVFILVGLVSAICAAEPDTASLYEVSTEGTSTSVKAGEKGKVVIAIHTKNGAHVSDEAPLRIELSAKNSKLDKEKVTLADSLTKKTADEKNTPDPRFEVGFSAGAKGKTTVEARMTFFICSETLCSRQIKNLTLPVEVN